jgi:hypothetical protein
MYAIRLGNQPIWFRNGKEITYETEEDALHALQEEMDECAHACEMGYMDDAGDFDNHRIVEVTA